MSKEVRTAADLERYVCERVWEAAAKKSAVKGVIGDFRRTLHFLVNGRQPAYDAVRDMSEIRAEAASDEVLADWKPAHPDRTYIHPHAAPIPTAPNDPAAITKLEGVLGIELKDASPLLVRSLQRALPRMNPALLPRIADAVRANPDHAQALLLAVSRGAENDMAREDLLAFSAHEQSGPMLDLYAHIAETSFDHEVRRMEIQRKLGEKTRMVLRPEQTMRRANLLLRMSERLIREHGSDPDPKRLETALGIVRDALWHTNETEQVIADVLKSMPKEKWSQVQLEALDGIDFLPVVRFQDIPDPARRDAIYDMMRRSFPDNWDDINAFCTSDEGYVTAAFCGDELIASIATIRLQSGILQFDYLCMNKRSELRGLTEAMVVQGLRKAKIELDAKGCYCVAKPQIRALQNQIENMGFVAYDLSGAEEPGTYIRCRQTKEEEGAYPTKTLPPEEVRRIVETLPDTNTLHARTVAGKECLVARVFFTAAVDGRAQDLANRWATTEPEDLPVEQRRMYDWIEENKGRYVLTRYVPIYGSPDTYGGVVQVYGAVFEPVAITPAEAEAFEKGLTEQ